MRFLILLAVLAGCKSAPVQYEMIEVDGGEKMQGVHGSIRKGRARQMPEVQFVKRSRDRCRDDPSDARKDDSQAGQALLGSDQVFYALRNRNEEATGRHQGAQGKAKE